MHARAGADTLKGFGGFDLLYGQGGADTVLGGPESDQLIGGVGNDALKGGGGDDGYFFADGWGRDTITDTAALGTSINFSGYLDAETPATDDVIVDLRSGTGPEAKDVAGTNTVNWEGSVIDVARGGAGDDRITGNASGNSLIGAGGADTVFGGGGNDEINVADGSSTDTVRCGPGDNDVVTYDEGYLGIVKDDVNLDDCEHLYPQ